MPSKTSALLEELKQTRPFHSAAHEALLSVLRTAAVVQRLTAQVVEASGVTVQQYNVLRILRGAGERGLPTLEIAERMIESTPGITRLVDRLETKKLVARERCLTDRRQVFCHITPAGLALLAVLDAPILHATNTALAILKKTELTSLIDLLDRTREHSNEQFIERRRSQ